MTSWLNSSSETTVIRGVRNWWDSDLFLRVTHLMVRRICFSNGSSSTPKWFPWACPLPCDFNVISFHVPFEVVFLAEKQTTCQSSCHKSYKTIHTMCITVHSERTCVLVTCCSSWTLGRVAYRYITWLDETLTSLKISQSLQPKPWKCKWCWSLYF